MELLPWRKVVMVAVVVMVGVAEALPDPSSAIGPTGGRQRRQIDTSHITDEIFQCVLMANDRNEDSSFCHDKAPSAPCTCVPVWQCRDNSISADLVDPEGGVSTLLDLRSNTGCRKPEDVCCVDVDPTALPPTPPAPVNSNIPICGKRNSHGVVNTFIGFANRETQFGEFPWTAAVISSMGFGKRQEPLFIAGGSLIHERLVLTAAHSVLELDPTHLSVRLGEWNLEEASEPVLHDTIQVAEKLIHPKYDAGAGKHYNDVAVLVLERAASLGPTVGTTCLPATRQDYQPSGCIVSGWGKDVFGETGRFQQIMKSIGLPLREHALCEGDLQRTRLGSSFRLHDSFMCAGGKEGQDACTGDGGSPLVCPLADDPKRYVQAGVVAWGIGCGRADVPGVYADVVAAVPWLDSVMAERFGELVLGRPDFDLRSGVDLRSNTGK